MQRCAACNQPFHEGDEIQRLPPLELALRGEKSGELGIYSTREGQVDYDDQDLVHHKYGCYEKYFSPLDNPFLYDSIANRVYEEREEQFKDEVREEFAQKFEEVKEMISEQKFSFCVECWKELEEDEPTYCLWCKSPNFVCMHQRRQGMTFFCAPCNKYWDDQENEITASQFYGE